MNNATINTLTLTVSDVNGCTASSTANIYVFTPSANFNITTVDNCGSVTAYDSMPNLDYSYAWQWNVTGPLGYASSSINQNPVFTFTLPGSYSTTLTVTNPGCSATYTDNSIAIAGPAAYFTYPPNSQCPPLTIPFVSHLTNGIQYEYIRWDFGDGSPSQFTYWPDSTISYTYYQNGSFLPLAQIAYQLPNGNICEFTDTNAIGVPIVIASNLDVDVTQDSIVIVEGHTDTLTSVYSDIGNNSPYTYNWLVYPDQSTLPIYNTSGAIYTADSSDAYIVLTLTDVDGCAAYDTVRLIVTPCEKAIKIPNIFTPNGDLLNDEYYIKDLCPIVDFEIKIFNRWGNVVYESKAYDFRWNGKDDNGKDCTEGTYYYVMRTKKNKLHGYIQLVRD